MVREATSRLKDPLHQRYDVMSKESCRDVLRRPQILVGWNVRKGALRIRPATPLLDLGKRLCILARLAELLAIGSRFRMRASDVAQCGATKILFVEAFVSPEIHVRRFPKRKDICFGGVIMVGGETRKEGDQRIQVLVIYATLASEQMLDNRGTQQLSLVRVEDSSLLSPPQYKQ